MTNISSDLTHKAGKFIAQLFIQQLPKELIFHNFHHTLNVVRGLNELIIDLNISLVAQGKLDYQKAVNTAQQKQLVLNSSF